MISLEQSHPGVFVEFLRGNYSSSKVLESLPNKLSTDQIEKDVLRDEEVKAVQKIFAKEVKICVQLFKTWESIQRNQ